MSAVWFGGTVNKHRQDRRWEVGSDEWVEGIGRQRRGKKKSVSLILVHTQTHTHTQGPRNCTSIWPSIALQHMHTALATLDGMLGTGRRWGGREQARQGCMQITAKKLGLKRKLNGFSDKFLVWFVSHTAVTVDLSPPSPLVLARKCPERRMLKHEKDFIHVDR